MNTLPALQARARPRPNWGGRDPRPRRFRSPVAVTFFRAFLVSIVCGLQLVRPLDGAPVDLAAIRARAEQGDAESVNELGNAYANGTGVPQDFAEGLRLYQRAAARGVAAAQFNLGMMHELGRGVPASAEKAFEFYLKAAQQGFAPAQFNVANMYANGVGVKADYFEAVLWFRQAADRKIAEAQYNLALAYEIGRGVTKDEVVAQRWYRAAAVQGFARAQFNLGLMLEEGRGSAVNHAEAIELYRAAASQNFLPAQNNLGILLAERRTSTADVVEAYTWLALAVENGANPAGRDIVARELSPAQIAEANAAVVKRRGQLGLADRSAPATPIALTPPPVKPSEVITAPPVGPKALDETEGLKREINRLINAMDSLRAEKSAVDQQLATVIRTGEVEREKGSRQLNTAQSALTESRQALEVLNAEIARLKAAATTETPAEQREQSALLTQLEKLTREVATLRTEKADLTSQLRALRAGVPGDGTITPDTRAFPLQELAAMDRRIAKLLADNKRFQDFIKRSAAEFSEFGKQLRPPDDRPSPGENRAAAAIPPGR